MVQGILPLEIETGRYRSPKLSLNSRICILCSRLKKFSSTSWSSADIASKSLDLKWASAGHKVRKCTSSPTSPLTPIAKTTKIIHQCATSPEVGKAVYRLYLERCNLLGNTHASSVHWSLNCQLTTSSLYLDMGHVTHWQQYQYSCKLRNTLWLDGYVYICVT